MVFSYFPGCTLKNKAIDLDRYARLCGEKLGVEIKEIDEWQCCGGVYPQLDDEIATKLASVRALVDAKREDGILLTVCSACHNVIKRVNLNIQTNPQVAMKINNYLKLDEPYKGETKVIHYLELLRDYVGFDKIKEAVVNKLNRNVAAFYGCLLLRPSKEMAFDNPENPSIIEDLITAMGGNAIKYPFRNECCGAYATFKSKEIPEVRSKMIIDSAVKAGAEEIITACPLCYYNLKKYSNDKIKVTYFTEVLAEALGVK